MLLIDDLLLSPVNGLLWIFRELHDVVQKERAGEAEAVTQALSELYLQLDSGAITEDQFSAEESRLLDRLDAIEARDANDEDGDTDTDTDTDDDVDPDPDSESELNDPSQLNAARLPDPSP